MLTFKYLITFWIFIHCCIITITNVTCIVLNSDDIIKPILLINNKNGNDNNDMFKFRKKPHKDIEHISNPNSNDNSNTNSKDTIEYRTYMTYIANHYNIYGFCYMYQYINNKFKYNEIADAMLLDNQPNIPFYFSFNNIDMLIINKNENQKHFKYISSFLKNKNYITINEKPVFAITMEHSHSNMNINIWLDEFITEWDAFADSENIPELYYIMLTNNNTNINNNNNSKSNLSGLMLHEPYYSLSTTTPSIYTNRSFPLN